jgi:tetraacyldisaccharide 4'-kinase
VLIADDGLQHYRLTRQAEIVVVDGERGFGNGLPLPSGPMREPPRRLRHVDAVVINATTIDTADRTRAAGRPVFAMELAAARLRNLADPGQTDELSRLRGERVHAVAGIGNPQRFFARLTRDGLLVTPHPFPDHYAYRAADLDFGDDKPILMTEKDAVKCSAFARANWWALEASAEVEPGLDELVIARLKRK